MLLGRFTKQPAERETYAIEYEDDLATADAILADPPPVVEIAVLTTLADTTPLRIDAIDVTGTRVTLWIAGGTVRQAYKITVTVTTSSGRILQDEFLIKIKDY